MIKVGLGALCSFLIPGLGQFFYGKWAWAALWLVLAICAGPVINIASAAHVVFIGVD